MTPCIFIDWSKSSETSLCVYIKDLDLSIQDARLRVEDGLWIEATVIDGVSDKVVFSDLIKHRIYQIDGQYMDRDVWVDISSTSFPTVEYNPSPPRQEIPTPTGRKPTMSLPEPPSTRLVGVIPKG